MWVHLFLPLVVLVGISAGQDQFQTAFQNFQATGRGSNQAEVTGGVPQRSSAGQVRGSQQTDDRRETTTPVPILKQINEHNEDGSYTYGYEAADGTFKLETRFPDGSVQGKYGYVDVNGDVKIIQYGADSMGFQPEGDLPDGIIIPPPVEGNCTDCDYDYLDGSENGQPPAEGELGSFQVANRARGDLPPSQQQQQQFFTPSQNRGQDLDQPITPAPLPRRPAFEPQPAFLQPAPKASQQPAAAAPPAFQPTRNFDSFQAQPAAPSRNPAPTANSGSFSNFPARNNPARGRTNSRPAQRPASLSSDFEPVNAVRQPIARRPSRPVPQQQQQPQQASGFQSFPVRQEQSQPLRPAFEDTAAVSLPDFTAFQPTGRQQGAPSVFSRPALTFQDSATAAVPASTLPKSALEIVDFNQLLQEFQGSQSRGSQPGSARFAARNSDNQQQQRFSTNNFPVRF